jgi:hypothetical protein
MRRLTIVLVAVLATAAGCGKHPSKEKANAACEHSVELGFMESSAAQGSDADTKAMLDEMKKGPLWKEAVEKCTKDAMEDATPEQVDCVLAAKLPSDIDKCK